MKQKNKSGDFYGWILELPLLLLCGGVGYYGIETLFRGYSHWSMAICGALCFLGIYRINERLLFLPLLVRGLLCACLITGGPLHLCRHVRWNPTKEQSCAFAKRRALCEDSVDAEPRKYALDATV